VPLDEHIEVHRVEILSYRVREPGDVARCNCPCDPLCECSALFRGAEFAALRSDLSQSAQALARQRLQDLIANT